MAITRKRPQHPKRLSVSAKASGNTAPKRRKKSNSNKKADAGEPDSREDSRPAAHAVRGAIQTTLTTRLPGRLQAAPSRTKVISAQTKVAKPHLVGRHSTKQLTIIPTLYTNINPLPAAVNAATPIAVTPPASETSARRPSPELHPNKMYSTEEVALMLDLRARLKSFGV